MLQALHVALALRAAICRSAAGQEAASEIFDGKGKPVTRVSAKGPAPGAMTKKGGKK
jgi:hypothetical protein